RAPKSARRPETGCGLRRRNVQPCVTQGSKHIYGGPEVCCRPSSSDAGVSVPSRRSSRTGLPLPSPSRAFPSRPSETHWITMDADLQVNGVLNGTANGVSNGDYLPSRPTPTDTSRPLARRSAGDALEDDSFYPLQKGPYMSPNYRLSAQSKKLVRQAQEPILSSSPATVHIIYE
ncbi:hypothetical protein ISCGN_021291, partial [Ixodes scapularis]